MQSPLAPFDVQPITEGAPSRQPAHGRARHAPRRPWAWAQEEGKLR